jgi:hypothetical protein
MHSSPSPRFSVIWMLAFLSRTFVDSDRFPGMSTILQLGRSIAICWHTSVLIR